MNHIEDSMPASAEHDEPEEYANLDELSAPEPAPSEEATLNNQPTEAIEPSELPDYGYDNLDELADPAPDENPDEQGVYRHSDLEDERAKEQRWEERSHSSQAAPNASDATTNKRATIYFNQFTVISYLILFSILGTLARLGLQALTKYPGAPIPNTELWANVGGSFVMGFIREDRLLFRHYWKNAVEDSWSKEKSKEGTGDNESQKSEKGETSDNLEAAVVAFAATKATIPAYIGLSVGFCGSFTSFSSFIRDAFLALANDLDTAAISTAVTTQVPRVRSDGYSVMAVLGVLFTEITMSIGALFCGAHTATMLQLLLDSMPTFALGGVLDMMVIVVGWGAWIGAVIMAIWPPIQSWRDQAIFALVFAPLGCLLRFQLSLHLNGRIRSFPLGTFAANVLGTCILGMSWDLQRSKLGALVGGGVIRCQVLQGIQDGFCGCLTTISTWVLELKGLRKSHAYVYGAVSVGVSLAMLVLIMGTLYWTQGYMIPLCKV